MESHKCWIHLEIVISKLQGRFWDHTGPHEMSLYRCFTRSSLKVQLFTNKVSFFLQSVFFLKIGAELLFFWVFWTSTWVWVSYNTGVLQAQCRTYVRAHTTWALNGERLAESTEAWLWKDAWKTVDGSEIWRENHRFDVRNLVNHGINYLFLNWWTPDFFHQQYLSKNMTVTGCIDALQIVIFFKLFRNRNQPFAIGINVDGYPFLWPNSRVHPGEVKKSKLE